MRTLTFILFTIFLVHQNLFSQPFSDSIYNIQQIEVTAQHIFKKEEAGMKETKIDSTILTEKANLSLSDVLAENTSVFIKNHGRGAMATASFRGTAPSHTNVNWNGMNINSPMTGMVDFSMIPVYIIDDMSLKHGTASIESQSGGLGGAINIENTVNWRNEFSARYTQGVGSYKTFDEFLQVNTGNSKIQSKTRLYHNYSKNNYTYINKKIGNINPETEEVNHPLDTNKNADYTKFGGMQEFYYRPNTNNVLSMKWWGQWSDRSLPKPTSYEGARNANINNQHTVDHKILLDWKNYANQDKLLVRSGYSRKNMRYVAKNRVPGKGFNADIYSKSTQNSFLNKVSYKRDITDDFSIKTSIDANLHDVVSRDTIKETGYSKKRKKFSGLVSLHKTFAGRLNVNLMLRQSWIDNGFIPFIPYLGFDYRLVKGREILLTGNIARNYHQPSLNDLYWQPGGNPDLSPEEGISGEIGLEYNRAARSYQLHSEITAYRSDINDWVMWVPSFKGYWEPRNVRRVLSQGIEAAMMINGHSGKLGYKVSGTYSYTQSINYGNKSTWGDESYGKQLAFVPVHSGNLLVKLTYQDYFITYQHNSYSERFTTSSNDITQRDWLYPYFMNNLSTGKTFKFDHFDISGELKVYNLFDETYHSSMHQPMPGRNYKFIVMLKF
jgi:iron complex outermembrane receptor protein